MIIEATASELRKTGISAIGDVPWGTHFCYFYETKPDLLETLVLYFKAGLESKEFCVWVVSEALTVEEARRALAQAVPDLERLLAGGALEIHSHDEWYLPSGRWDSQRVLQSWREKLNHTTTNGYTGLRAAGDGGWVQNDDWMAFREYEKQVNALIADQRSIILCTYPLTTSPADQVFDVAHIHEAAVARRNGTWETIEIPALKEAKAIIKRLNEELEEKVEERTRELATTNKALRTEIAERKLAEEALRKSERLFAAFMDHLPGFAWMKDTKGHYVYVNKKEAALDVYRDGVIGKTDAELWPEEIASAYLANDRQVLTTRKELQTVEPSLAGGERSFMLVSKFPIFDRDGSVVMVAGAGVDITDLTQAKNALNAQALRYKTLMATSTDSIYVVDEKGDLQEANAAFLGRRGYTAAEVKGLNVADWDAHWKPDKMRERLFGLRESSAVFETQHRCKDGSLFDVEVCATGVRIAGEQLFFCVTRDITERKQAERALRESEARFRRLLASNIIGVVFWALQGDIFEANDLFLNMVGYTREDLRQGRISWKNLTPPEYAAVDEKALAELIATGTCFPFEKEYVRKDGSRFSVLIGSALLEPQKETGSSFVMDISERKQAEDRLRRSEEKFKTLFGIAPIGISVLDRQHHVIDANPALEQITRLRREELLNGTHRDRRILNADGTPMRSHEFPSERAMAQNRPVNDVETGIVTENGETIWVQVSVAPLDLPDAGAVVITQDITERKQAAEALEAANHQLRILSRQLFHIQEEERRHLARELHDEIGQTLTAAKINLKIIAPDVPAKSARRLDDSIQLLDRLLRQVRELSLDLRPPLLDELGLVPTLRWLVDQQAKRAGLRVTFTANVDGLELDPDVQTACFRVAQEAITNIIRHSGAKNFTVELRREEERLWLTVRDDGAGFDPDVILQNAAQHSSLGLVSMKERALLVHGGLEVHTAPREGTEIRAWFPLARGEHPSTAESV